MGTYGKVKWFSDSNGYGLIEKEDGGEILEHFTRISTSGNKLLGEHEDVMFDSFTHPKGPNAPHVVRLILTPNQPSESGR